VLTTRTPSAIQRQQQTLPLGLQVVNDEPRPAGTDLRSFWWAFTPMKLVWTQQAFDRLVEIEDFVGLDDPHAAVALIDGFIDRAMVLENFPRIGRQLPEAPGSDLRELIEGKYRIVYRVSGDLIEVLTVFEGHRLLRPEEIK